MTFADDFAMFASGNLPAGIALIIANAVIAAGFMLAGRRLPAGVALGGAATSAAIALVTFFSLIRLAEIAVPVSLIVLCIGGYLLRQNLRSRETPERDEVDQSVARGIVAICGVMLAAWLLSRLIAPAEPSSLARFGYVFSLVAALAAAGSTPPWTILFLPCATALFLLEFLLGHTIPSADVASLAAAAAALGLVLGHVISGWKRRNREWLDAPAALAERAPLHGGAAITALAMLSGAAAVFGGGWSVWAVWAAAYAALGVAHLTRSPIAGRIGLLLIAEIPVLAAARWFWDGVPGLLLGFLLAALLLLWLSRFWQQQVDGEPWTTTGRLIPDARAVALTMIALACGTTIAMAGMTPSPGARLGGSIASTLLMLIALGSWAFFGAQARSGHAALRIGTLLAMTAAAFTLHPLIVNVELQRWLSPIVSLPAFAVVQSIRNRAAPQPLYRVFSLAVLPLMLFAALVMQGFTGPLLLALVFVLGAAAMA